jgi:hypothetical protein
VAVLSDLVLKVRSELADQPKQFTKTFTGNGVIKDYDLGIKPLDNGTLIVEVNGDPVAQPTGYTVESRFGVIHFPDPPADGEKIVITGNVFRYFTDDEILNFVNIAITQHTFNKTDGYGRQVTVSNVPAVEEYPIVVLSVIEALWALATDAAFDINIFAPDGVTIPRSERYHQLTGLIQQRWEQYTKLCAALNIGLWRIEVGMLRRTSKRTNKLIPVYVPQEIDDSRRPERVYINTDIMGRTPTPTTVPVYDILLYQGDSWTGIFDFPFDVTGYRFKAQIRTYPNSPSLYATFNIEIIDAAAGKIRLSLTTSQTEYIPVRAFWDLQAKRDDDPDFEQTYIKGQVFTEQQITLD